MNTKDMIKVMQHYVDGGQIECLNTFKVDEGSMWYGLTKAVWDWEQFEYRIKPVEKKPVVIETWSDRVGLICQTIAGGVESRHCNKNTEFTLLSTKSLDV